MDSRFHSIAVLAAANHSVVSLADLQRRGVSSRLLSEWLQMGRLVRLGPRAFTVAGAAPTWHRDVAAGLADLGGFGFIAGRAGFKLHGLDDFTDASPEFLLPRAHRDMRTVARTAATSQEISWSDRCTIDGLRTLRPMRLILDSPRFGFTRREIENAIDSSIRLRLVSEQRLRARVVAQHSRGINGSRALLDALVDSGGESRLERMMLRLIREAGLRRPATQQVHRADGRLIARVDFQFADGLIVEVAGHGTHSSRAERQRDEQRRTELTLRGYRVITFTYEDVRDRPGWVVARLREAQNGQRWRSFLGRTEDSPPASA